MWARKVTNATLFELRRDSSLQRGPALEVSVDGQLVVAYLGETVAGLMMRLGRRALRRTARFSAYRGLHCGMGVCYDCLMVVDGVPNTRACMTYIAAGTRIWTQVGWGEGAKAKPETSSDQGDIAEHGCL